MFALNQTTHPGEKRLLEIASKLDKVPVDMVKDITDYFHISQEEYGSALVILEGIVNKLHKLLEDNNYHYSIRTYQ